MPGMSYEEAVKGGATGGLVQQAVPDKVPEVSTMDAIGAGLRLNSPTFNLLQKQEDERSFDLSGDLDPNFDPREHVAGYEEHWDYLSQSLNEHEMNLRKGVIDRDRKLRQQVQLAGGAGLVGGVLGSVVDPVMLASMAAPVGYGVRLGTAVKGAAAVGATVGAETVALESVLHSAQPGRTMMESVYSVSGSVLLGGFLGSVVGKLGQWDAMRLAREIEREATGLDPYTSKGTSVLTDFQTQLDDLKTRLNDAHNTGAVARLNQISKWESEGAKPHAIVRALEQGTTPDKVNLDDLADVIREHEAESAMVAAHQGAPASVGAAAVVPEYPVLVGGRAVRSAAQISPVGRIATAVSGVTRELGLRLASNALRFTSSKTGLPMPSPFSAETGIKGWIGAVNTARWKGVNPAYNAYRTRMKQAGQSYLPKRKFRTEVGHAMRRGDEHPTIPEAGAAAKAYRKAVEPLFREGIKARVFDDLVRALSREVSSEPHERLTMQRRAALRDYKRFLKAQSRDRRRAITTGARTSQKTLTATRDAHLAEIEAFYAEREPWLKQAAAAELASRLREFDALDEEIKKTVPQRIQIEAEVRAEFDAKVAEWRSRQQKHIAAVKRVYKTYDDTQQAITRNVYSQMIRTLREAQETKVNALLAPLGPNSTTAQRAAAVATVARETRAAIRALNRQQREILKGEVKQYRADKRALLKERNTAWRELDKSLNDALDEAELDFATGSRGEFSDAVMSAYLKETPAEYMTPFTKEAVEALSKRIDDEATNGRYLTRVYNVQKIIKTGDALARSIADYWVKTLKVTLRDDQGKAIGKGPMPHSAALELAEEAVKKIVGYGDSFAPTRMTGPTRASMQLARELNVPDEVIEPWLHSDADAIVMDYARKIGSRVELSKASNYYGQAGAWRLTDDLNDVRRDYERLHRAATSAAERVAINNEMKQRIADISAVRDRLLGIYDLKPGDEIGTLSRLGANIKEINFLSRMGNMALASVNDLAQPILAFGLMRSYGKILRNLGSGVFTIAGKMTRAELIKAGTAADLVVPLLSKLAHDMGDVPVNQYLHAAGQAFTHATGMSVWNTAMKTLSGIMLQDELFTVAKRLAPKIDAGTLTKRDLRDLSDMARFGYDQASLRQLADMPTVRVGGLHVADVDAWDNARFAHFYRGTLANMVDTMVITPGAGDKFRWIRGQTAGLVTQFKSYAIAAHSKAMLPFMQDPDGMRQVSALGAQVGMGALVMYLRAAVADSGTGENKKTDAINKMFEDGEYYGLARMIVGNTSLATVASEVESIGGSFLGLEGTGRFPMSTWAQTMLGPTVGYGEAVWDVGHALGPNQEFTGNTLHTLRLMTPFQGVFWYNGLVNRLEREIVDEAGLKPRK